jgi:hypothetical protein
MTATIFTPTQVALEGEVMACGQQIMAHLYANVVRAERE